MRNKYYPNSIKFIKKKLKNKFPKVKPKRGQKNIMAHLLWMADEMQGFNDSAKAGRWMGWIIAHAEILGVITNSQSRELAKKDSAEGFV